MADEDNYRTLSQQVSETRAQGKKLRSDSAKAGVRAAGSSLNASGQAMMSRARDEAAERASNPPSYKRGGMVRKTGKIRAHRGEMVVPRGTVKRLKKLMRKTKRR